MSSDDVSLEHRMPKTILLVEDEAVIALNEAAILQNHGYKVISALSAEKAISIAEEQELDLILMDIDLGHDKMSGTEAAVHILRYNDLPIVFLSSHTEREVVEQTEGITSYGYIVKHTGETVLIASIKMAFRLFNSKMEGKRKTAALRESEEKFRSIVNSSPMGIYLYELHEDGRLILIGSNPAADKLTGIKNAGLIGLTIEEAFPGLIATELPDRYRKAAAEGESWFAEQIGYEDDKIAGIFEVYAFQTEPNKMCVMFSEITDWMKASRELRENREKYKKLVNNLPFAIFEADETGRIFIINDLMAQYLGQNKENLAGRNIRQFTPPELIEKRRSLIQDALKSKEILCFTDNFKDRTFIHTIVPVESEAGMRILIIAQDITGQKQNEAIIAMNEQRFRALYENAPLPYQSLDEDGCFIDVNPAWLRTLGYEKEEVIGNSFSDFLHTDWQPLFVKNFPEFKRRGYVKDVQFKMKHKNGHFIDTNFEGCIGYKPDGRFGQTYCVFQDITSQKKLEESLLLAYYEMDEIFNAAVPLCVISKDYSILRVNDFFCTLFGIRKDTVLGMKCHDVFRGSNCMTDRCEIKQIMAGMESPSHSFTLQRDNNKTIELLVKAEPFKNMEGETVGVIESFFDITEQRNAEEELVKREKEYRELAGHLQTVREEQNALLARELHDDLGQYLTAIKMNISLLQGDLRNTFGDNPNPLYSNTISEIEALLDETVVRTREIIKVLRPSVLDTKNIIEAIGWLVEESRRYASVPVDFSFNVENLGLGDEASLVVFRIVQEALTNCIRHSKASRVRVIVNKMEGSILQFSIEDDGCGYVQNETGSTKTFGILGMRERARSCGAMLDIRSRKGEGTKVILTYKLGVN